MIEFTSLAFPHDRAEDVHQFLRFLHKQIPFSRDCLIRRFNLSQPVTAFLCLFSADLDSKNKVLFA
jgi:hypothetical protein